MKYYVIVIDMKSNLNRSDMYMLLGSKKCS